MVVLKVMWKLRVDTDLRCNMSALGHAEFTEEKKTFLSENERPMVLDRERVQGVWGN